MKGTLRGDLKATRFTSIYQAASSLFKSARAENSERDKRYHAELARLKAREVWCVRVCGCMRACSLASARASVRAPFLALLVWRMSADATRHRRQKEGRQSASSPMRPERTEPVKL